MRLVIATNIPSAYRTPLFERVDALLRSLGGGGLTVVYGSRSQPGRQWAGQPDTGSVESSFVADDPVLFRGRALYADPRAVFRVRAARPDVVVIGGFAPYTYALAGWCRAARVPYLLWSGEMPWTSGGRMQRVRRRPLVRAASAYLAYAPAAASYLEEIGADRARIAVVGNGIDVDAFARRVDKARASRASFREHHGICGALVLSVGGKGLDLLQPALALLGRPATLAIAGKTGRSTETRIFLGRLQPEQMPAVYAAADVVVHPKADQWPHAINEALSGGVPVVATPRTGVPDGVLAGPRCALVEPIPEAIASAILRAVEGDPPNAAEREAIRDRIRPWSVEGMAERIVAAARGVL